MKNISVVYVYIRSSYDNAEYPLWLHLFPTKFTNTSLNRHFVTAICNKRSMYIYYKLHILRLLYIAVTKSLFNKRSMCIYEA